MVEINNTTRQTINLSKTRQIVEYFLATHRKASWEVSVAVVGASRMRQLNKKYRRMDKTTDVLSFRGGEAMNKFLGEIIINAVETRQPEKYREIFGSRKSPSYIFYFLLVHGLLHLVGYDDGTEKERQKMIRLGHKFLEEIF